MTTISVRGTVGGKSLGGALSAQVSVPTHPPEAAPPDRATCQLILGPLPTHLPGSTTSARSASREMRRAHRGFTGLFAAAANEARPGK
jgi:hypothetical protein